MITELQLKLKYQSEEKLSYQIASAMHGILMEYVDRIYGDYLHENRLKPFSQSVLDIQENTFLWRICTLTEDAKIKIINRLVEEKEFYLKHRNLRLQVCEKTLREISYDALIEEYYFQEQGRNITIEFYSPTAFKSQGTYVFIPTVRLIFQSLIQKYDYFSQETAIGSEEVMEHIEKYVSIVRYRLRSVRFSLEGTKVPAFVGMVTFRVKGPQQLVNLIKMLAVFGQYSSVGIKTALGMGQMRVKGES